MLIFLSGPKAYPRSSHPHEQRILITYRRCWIPRQSCGPLLVKTYWPQHCNVRFRPAVLLLLFMAASTYQGHTRTLNVFGSYSSPVTTPGNIPTLYKIIIHKCSRVNCYYTCQGIRRPCYIDVGENPAAHRHIEIAVTNMQIL